MDTPMVIAACVLLMVKLAVQEQYAQECQVYRLQGGTGQHYKTPSILIHNLLTVSFYNKDEGDLPTNVHILLKDSSEGSEKIHINPDGTVFISSSNRNENISLSGSCQPNTWVSLAVLLQDQNIIVYRIDERDKIISANALLGTNVTAQVTTSMNPLYVTLNCPAGCLMNDKDSHLINQWIAVEESVSIYVSHETGATKPFLLLVFKDHQHKNRSIKVDITKWKPSLWHKVVITHDKQKNIIVTGNGNQIGQALMAEENATFAIQNATSVLWSLHCHPDHATGLEAWGQSTNVTGDGDLTPDDKDDEGAGVGEVLAWLLAGIALFMVMVMALLLCTKMRPTRSGSLDYAGASVGVVTSFGRQQMTFRNAEREAEEDTEPDSPTFLAPVIHHKVPEEEDEQQSNTKML